jgi:hypothetical protein
MNNFTTQSNSSPDIRHLCSKQVPIPSKTTSAMIDGQLNDAANQEYVVNDNVMMNDGIESDEILVFGNQQKYVNHCNGDRDCDCYMGCHKYVNPILRLLIKNM